MPKVCIITGASAGIGKASAIKLADDGFQIVLVGRRAELLKQVQSELTHSGDHFCVAADVSVTEDIQAVIDATLGRYGRIDVLFNNAGVMLPATPLEDIDTQAVRDVVAINTLGAFEMAQAAYRQMKEQTPQGGRIINNGSISAHVPRPHGVAYNISKSAITGLTKSISLEGRAYNIACGQIDIGNTASDMTDQMAKGMLQADGSTKPEPTFDVKHVADAVSYMANLPLNANVQFMTVMATHMPYIGRG